MVAPLLAALEQPIRATREGLERLAGVSDIYVENQTLRQENEELRQWYEEARRLISENTKLRQILKAPGQEITPSATGRVVGIGGGQFERSLVLNVGARDGVKRQQPVVDVDGLVGRIIHVGHWSSRILLLTDLNSRVPVMVEGGGQLGILEGQNEPLMRLRFVTGEAGSLIGARLLTSGHGGIFPPDLPVGHVVSRNGDDFLVRPVALLDAVGRVKVLDYHVPPPEASRPGQEAELQSAGLQKDGAR